MEDLVADDEPTEREKRQVEEFARRKAKSRFYADENFPQLATAILRRLKADVLTAQTNRRRGHPDENHAAEACALDGSLSPAIATTSTHAVSHCYTVLPWLSAILVEEPLARYGTRSNAWAPFSVCRSSSTNGRRSMQGVIVGRNMLAISTVLPRDGDTDLIVAECSNGSVRAFRRKMRELSGVEFSHSRVPKCSSAWGMTLPNELGMTS